MLCIECPNLSGHFHFLCALHFYISEILIPSWIAGFYPSDLSIFLTANFQFYLSKKKKNCKTLFYTKATIQLAIPMYLLSRTRWLSYYLHTLQYTMYNCTWITLLIVNMNRSQLRCGCMSEQTTERSVRSSIQQHSRTIIHNVIVVSTIATIQANNMQFRISTIAISCIVHTMHVCLCLFMCVGALLRQYGFLNTGFARDLFLVRFFFISVSTQSMHGILLEMTIVFFNFHHTVIGFAFVYWIQ